MGIRHTDDEINFISVFYATKLWVSLDGSNFVGGLNSVKI